MTTVLFTVGAFALGVAVGALAMKFLGGKAEEKIKQL